MYCPDGSCVSFATGTCVTSGPIYTAQIGCRALSTCNTGNHGLIVIGENDSLLPQQGGVPFASSLTLSAPPKNPCALMIANPTGVSMSFYSTTADNFNWYSLQLVNNLY